MTGYDLTNKEKKMNHIEMAEASCELEFDREKKYNERKNVV